MITAEEREESFKKDLIELLRKHGAELEITDDGGVFGMQMGTAEVNIPAVWDGDGNLLREFSFFNLPTYLP